jgi:hypothetical protein
MDSGRLRCMWSVGVFLLISLASTIDAEIRCAQGGIGNTCPDEAPVCCFIGSEFSMGCCRAGQYCTDTGCAEAQLPTNTSWSGFESVSMMVHLSVVNIIVVFCIASGLLVGCFLCVCGCGQAKARGREKIALLLAERRRRREPNSDDDYDVSSDEESRYRKKLVPGKTERRRSGEANAKTTCNMRAQRTIEDGLENDGTGDQSREETGTNPAAAPTPSDDSQTSVPADPGTPQAPNSHVELCSVCRAEPINIVLLDCSHSVCCEYCARHLKRCPECHALIRRRKKIFYLA